MHKLKSLKIKNFQCHRNTTIVFSSGITGIIGKSNTGKTSILRSMEWLFTNRPAGFNFHSNFTKQKKTEVSCIIENNIYIAHSKIKSKSTYTINKLNSRKKPAQFKGKNVPDIIKEKFNISEVNIQRQMDPPFLITSPPGQIAETINKATKIDQIDLWIKKTNSMINSRGTELKVIEDDIEKLEKQLQKFEPLENIANMILKLKKLDKKIENKVLKLAELSGIKASLKAARTELRISKQYNKIKKKIVMLEAVNQKIFELNREEDLIAEYAIKKRDIKTAVIAHKQLQSKYIKEVKKSNECPFCFGKLTKNKITKIKQEIAL
jgi:exonuclease SbcC